MKRVMIHEEKVAFVTQLSSMAGATLDNGNKGYIIHFKQVSGDCTQQDVIRGSLSKILSCSNCFVKPNIISHLGVFLNIYSLATLLRTPVQLLANQRITW